MIDRLALEVDSLENREGSHTAVVMNSSQDLVARARAGDHEAFGLLFERHANHVLGFLFHLIGQREVAEELTQETFVRAYRGLPEFRDESKFSTWLFGIARNTAREWLRSQAGRDGNAPADLESLPQPDGLPSPVDELLGKELNTAILGALEFLDEDRRAVFALKVLQQRSYQEIVEITGFSLAKVKIELHRARGEMRRRLRPYLETK
ncbi:MAG TPA: sigma-70 family RNA polymerase sigma factor [Pyrinomonadaceae bacterium]|nr:sigma-70 family RNA polymerase sigma factor [Pyrinomonadaceae bacterium]